MNAPGRPERSPRLSVDSEGLAEITFDDPDRSANILSDSVMRHLGELIDELRTRISRGSVRGVIFRSGKASSFIVGADIDEIAEIDSAAQGTRAAALGQAIYLEVERLSIPTVAAIHGTCLGGGLELALACRYRLASDHPKTKLGLPEVQLGILPAWGGTTRLPRLIGLRPALDLMLTGKTVDAERARSMGLIEAVFPHARFEDECRTFLDERIREGDVPTGARRALGTRLIEGTPPGRKIILTVAERKVKERTDGHYPAPLRILEVVRASSGRPLDRALQIEAAAAGELIASPESKHLVHVFRLRERARKGTGVAGTADPKEVSALGVVGAGIMGGGIAQLAASHGIRVRLTDLRREAVTQAFQHASRLFDTAVERRKLARRDAVAAMDLISGGTDNSGFGSLDLVVEAVVEKLEVKQEVLVDLESRVSGACILATNTSSLSVNAMAESLQAPGRFLGMHFFNPVHKMPLVEVVRGRDTDDETVATVYALALRLDKVPVVVNDGPGFLVNRILGPYLNEGGHLLADGASVEEVDGAATRFGMPMGPLRLIDEVGVDVMRHAGETLHKAFGLRLAPARPLVQLGESERLGKKGGVGIYRYDDGRSKSVDDELYAVLDLPDPSRRDRREPEEVLDRLLFSMINEAARTLSDEVAASAADVDLAMIMGTGFPPFRGGLLRLADGMGLDIVVGKLRELEQSVGSRFAPAPLLTQLSREGRGFYEAFPAEEL